MILYFTGTGNSRWVAERLAEETKEKAINIAHLTEQKREITEKLMKGESFGIIFPIHSWYAPRILIEFLQQIHLPHQTYRYAVCTCGDDAGKGLQRLSGHFRLDAAWSVAMPNTYIPMFELDDDTLCFKKIEEARIRISSIAKDILAQKHVWEVHEGKAAWLKTYIVNPLFNRFVIHSKGFRSDEGCTSCSACVNSCPMNNIRLQEKHPVWGKGCIHCMACIHICPHEVIQYKNSTRQKGRYHLKKYLTRP
ncbi:flavodoxin-like protein [Bacteroides zoogleoformans]|uniref:(4Fe-4S)-binding protein n=1 Tax=Bacteroides zoogleoformans TaxID=28119 RepID=A0ABN5II30_9BACE|nr:EFR1 family ferrodoxin [Bacteroides zoogleoformans]AVM52440.1 (4Fe-4S)-binding protein [Bacteroides zoogleoformans]TWJ11007.1 flavodoxin-like protein [Bacteroides zoogleoformans]